MNDLCADIGYTSICRPDEDFCEDNICVTDENEASKVIVLARGSGTGIKANILSAFTSRMLSGMIASEIPEDDCIETISDSHTEYLGNNTEYSTYTTFHIINNEQADIIQHGTPSVILIRDGKQTDFPTTELNICEKKIIKARITLQEGDIFVLLSNGFVDTENEVSGWGKKDIIDFMETLAPVGYTSKTLCTAFIEEHNRHFGEDIENSATVCIIRIRKRVPMNMLFGPPANRDDCNRMMSLFFSKKGKHIVCGGTTASIAAQFLGKKLVPSIEFEDEEIPPTATIEGVDLVTEGVITVNKVLTYAKDYVAENKLYDEWSFKRDAASMISRLLFEEATDINFYVGRAVNPAHQNPSLPITFSIKMNLVTELSDCLKKMGKRIKVCYF